MPLQSLFCHLHENLLASWRFITAEHFELWLEFFRFHGVSFLSFLEKKNYKWEVFCFVFLVYFMLGFSWQRVHCRQWTRNHQHWADPSCTLGPFLEGHLSLPDSFVQKSDSHYLCVGGNKDGVFRFVFFLFLPEKMCRFDVFTPPIWCYWMTNLVPKVLWT